MMRETDPAKPWIGRRMGEVIGCHFKPEEAKILGVLFLNNGGKDGEENYLELMHPGNVEAKLTTSSPLPNHPDEPVDDSHQNILNTIYGDAFDIKRAKDSQKICEIQQVKALSQWEIWYELDDNPYSQINWPEDPRTQDKPPKIKKIFPQEGKSGFVPFTIWRVGPFVKKGPVLFSFEMILKGESFYEFVSRERVFTIDGPERILFRIEFGYIPLLPEKERGAWLNKLKTFENYIKAKSGYDIILLGSKLADALTVGQQSCASKAGLQLESEDIGVRYLTDDANYRMIVGKPLTAQAAQ